MRKINGLLLPLLFFWGIAPLPLLAQPMRGTVPSKQRYVYDIYYKKFSVGKIIRELQGNGVELRANTTADLSFLFYHFGGNQRSDIYWDERAQLFLSKKFTRNSVGFSPISMETDFFQSGHRTIVIRKGKSTEFINKKGKIIDFNTIGVQISEGLKVGQTYFEFYMQTSDSVAHYFFEVKGKEAIATKLGQFITYRVEQTHKKDRQLIAWFAPEMNYQMVKFHYQRKLLDIHGVLSERSMINL